MIMQFSDFLHNCLMEKLTERQKQIVMWRTQDVFGIGKNEKTLREIGAIYGITGSRIRDIARTARRKIEYRIRLINDRIGEPQVIVKYVKKPEEQPTANLPILYKPVGALGEMSVRTTNCLRNEDVHTVEQLIKKPTYELMRWPNFGRKSLRELEILLEQNGLKFGMDI